MKGTTYFAALMLSTVEASPAGDVHEVQQKLKNALCTAGKAAAITVALVANTWFFGPTGLLGNMALDVAANHPEIITEQQNARIANCPRGALWNFFKEHELAFSTNNDSVNLTDKAKVNPEDRSKLIEMLQKSFKQSLVHYGTVQETKVHALRAGSEKIRELGKNAADYVSNAVYRNMHGTQD